MGKRLSDQERVTMYEQYMTGGYTVRQLAAEYGINETTANNIIGTQLPAKIKDSPEQEPKPKRIQGAARKRLNRMVREARRVPQIDNKKIDY